MTAAVVAPAGILRAQQTAVPAPQSAAPAPQAAGGQNEEIVVTAEKRNSTVLKTPISMTALSGAQLQAQGITSVEQMVGEVPGISMRSAGPGQTEYEMRGLSSAGGSSPTVGFYMDDIPLTAPAVALNGKVVIDPDLYDLNRVEVLRGPQGTLYGSGSMGGTIKLVTNKPKLDGFEGSIDVGLSGTAGGGINPGVSAMLNVPVINDKLALRVVGTEKYVSGWIDRIVVDPFPLPTNQGCAPTPFLGCNPGNVGGAPRTATYKNVNWEHLQGIRLSLLAKPTDRLTIDLSTFYQRISQGGYSEYDAYPGLTPIGGQLAHYQPFDQAEPISDKFMSYSLSLNYDLGFASLTSATAYWRRTEAQNQDGDEAATDVLLLSQYYNLPNPETDLSHQFSEEMRIASSSQSPFQWVAGVFYASFDSTYKFYSNDPALCYLSTGGCAANPQGVSFSANNPYTIDQYALFGEASYKIANKLKLTAGLRWYEFKNKEQFYEFGYFATSGNLTPVAGVVSSINKGVNPKFNIAYTPDNDMTLYATAARGFRPGGVNLPVPLSGPESCLPALQAQGLSSFPLSYGPDSIWNYEVGEKARLLGGKLTINGDIYDNQWKGVQLISTLSCGFPYDNNAGNARTYGPELEVNADLGYGFRLNFTGTYTSAILNHAAPSSGYVSGSQIIEIPKYTESTSLTYSHQLWDGYVLNTRISNSYVGRQLDLAYTPISLPPYDIVNFRTTISTDQWNASVFVSNLTNKHAAITTNNTNVSEVIPALTRVTTNQPLTAGVEVQYKF
jgi:outer membrane receptor protein involved in Fe transport